MLTSPKSNPFLDSIERIDSAHAEYLHTHARLTHLLETQQNRYGRLFFRIFLHHMKNKPNG